MICPLLQKWNLMFKFVHTDHLCCLAGSTQTTFTLVLPINLQRISTRRCQSRCSYSRGALRSTQCAPVCTTLLSTMPCQWVCPPPCFLSCNPAEHRTQATSVLADGKKEAERSEKDRWSEIHTSLAHAKACRMDFMKGIGSTVEPPSRVGSRASLCARKP